MTDNHDGTPAADAAHADVRFEFDRMVEQLYATLQSHGHRLYDAKLKGLSQTANALVHEALMRLAQARQPPQSEGQFVAAALQLMRYEYLDHLKRRYAARHGGGCVKHLGEHADRFSAATEYGDPDLVDTVGQALVALENHDPLMAEVVLLSDCRGWPMDRIAEVTGVPKRTLERHKAQAYAWLRGYPPFKRLIADT